MKFKLEIELGNDAMQSGRDVADALNNVAFQLQDVTMRLEEMGGMVVDENGNTVGAWQVEEEVPS